MRNRRDASHKFARMQGLLENAFLHSSVQSMVLALLYLPVLLLSSLGLLVSFLYMVNFSFFVGICESCVMGAYTAMTRRVHLPKHRRPRKFTPSISFMGGMHQFPSD
jgi:hypothetical protein